jgi:hypothetical protein
VAFEDLENLHRSAGRWESLVEVYLARLEVVDKQHARNDLWRRVARIFEECRRSSRSASIQRPA